MCKFDIQPERILYNIIQILRRLAFVVFGIRALPSELPQWKSAQSRAAEQECRGFESHLRQQFFFGKLRSCLVCCCIVLCCIALLCYLTVLHATCIAIFLYTERWCQCLDYGTKYLLTKAGSGILCCT